MCIVIILIALIILYNKEYAYNQQKYGKIDQRRNN